MNTYKRIFKLVIFFTAVVFAWANLYFYCLDFRDGGRPYRVEIERLALQIEKEGLKNVSLSHCKYVSHIQPFGEDFYDSDRDYVIKEIDGKLYRFDYSCKNAADKNKILIPLNLILLLISGLMLGVLIFVKNRILSPFERLKNLPYELSKGNLTLPLKENKSRFFGKFIWGMDLLRENLEEQKQRELTLQKEKKTLLLSLSHDIKTPLSAIKLYAKALTKNLYSDREKQIEVAENINKKADEIEGYVSQIITASKEDFLSLNVEISEFYLSDLMEALSGYYREKLALVKTDFYVGKYDNCILSGDFHRSVEILQNLMENAIKYGNGHSIEIEISKEEGCRLISVKNSGCTLSDLELPHIFESFWRGSNSQNIPGSGLGLSICRQLANSMGGEILAEADGEWFQVTVVFRMAG